MQPCAKAGLLDKCSSMQKLIELVRRQSIRILASSRERSNQRELQRVMMSMTRPASNRACFGEREAMFNFVLHVGQRLAGEE